MEDERERTEEAGSCGGGHYRRGAGQQGKQRLALKLCSRKIKMQNAVVGFFPFVFGSILGLFNGNGLAFFFVKNQIIIIFFFGVQISLLVNSNLLLFLLSFFKKKKIVLAFLLETSKL